MNKWTKKRPTAGGWYWWRSRSLQQPAQVCKVYRYSSDEGLMVAFLDGERYPLSGIDGEWYPVPITKPEES